MPVTDCIMKAPLKNNGTNTGRKHVPFCNVYETAEMWAGLESGGSQRGAPKVGAPRCGGSLAGPPCWAADARTQSPQCGG